MKAMVINEIVSLLEDEAPLELVELPTPEPKAGEVRLKVLACGVCHTELDEIEGRTAPPVFPVVPGHEVIGRFDKLGTGTTRFREGERVGVGWIHSSTGTADENITPEFKATGRDVNGGYAEFMTVPVDYAYPFRRSSPTLKLRPSCARAELATVRLNLLILGTVSVLALQALADQPIFDPPSNWWTPFCSISELSKGVHQFEGGSPLRPSL